MADDRSTTETPRLPWPPMRIEFEDDGELMVLNFTDYTAEESERDRGRWEEAKRRAATLAKEIPDD